MWSLVTIMMMINVTEVSKKKMVIIMILIMIMTYRMPALWGGCLLLSLISMACQCQAVSLAKADAVG